MSVIFAGGELESFNLVGVNQQVNATAGKFDSDFARMAIEHGGSGASNWIGANFTGGTEFWLHLVVNMDVGPGSTYDYSIIRLVDSVSGETVFQIDGTDGNFRGEYWNGSSFTTMPSTFTFSTNVNKTIDIHCKIHDTLGRFAIYLDNSLWDEFTGDTNLFASAQVDGIELCGPTFSLDFTKSANFSEVIVADEPTIGWRLATLIPNAAGTTSAWTGAYTDVDEIAVDDGDFLSSDTANQVHTMGASNLSVAAAAMEIQALLLNARARKGVSGPTQLQLAVRTGAADFFSSSFALDPGFISIQNMWALNPDTVVAWTPSEIDGVEIGVKSIT